MEEEQNKQEEMTSTEAGASSLEVSLPLHQELVSRAAQKAQAAAKSRERTARLNALGLTSRGKPKGERGRTPERQREWQHKFYMKNKAARTALGLTIAEFNKLPAKERERQRNLAMKGTKAEPSRRTKAAAPRQTKAPPVVANNGLLPSDDRSVRFCPHCGWNIDATRKAQAFVDGRVA